MYGKFQFRKLQFGESIEGKLFFETVRPYHNSDSKILIGEQLMIFILNTVHIMLSFWWYLSIKCKRNKKK